MSGSSYYSQNDLRLHFGLGRAATADAVEVAWPSGLQGDASGTCPPTTSSSSRRRRGSSSGRRLGVGRPCAGAVRRVPLGRCSWRRRCWLLAARTPLPTCSSRTSPQAVGIDFKHENSATSNKYLIETMGGGVALLDYDNDGRLDIFFTNGAKLDDPMPAGKAARQVGPRVLEPALPPERGRHVHRRHREGRPHRNAAEPLRHGRRGRRLRQRRLRGPLRHQLRRQHALPQQRRRHLHRRHRAAPASAAGGWSASAGFFDYDNDGRLDLFVTRYVDWTFENNRYCGEQKPGYRAYCHPDNYEGMTNLLYHNNGDGTFTDVSAKAGIADADGQGAGRRVRRLRRRRLHRHLRRQRLRAVASSTTTTATARSPRSGCSPASASTRTARPSPAWAWTSPTTTTTAGPTSSSPISPTSATALSPERRRQLPRRDQRSGVGRRHAAVLRLEHALLRLRQRRLEGPLRRPGTRDGHHREDRRPT